MLSWLDYCCSLAPSVRLSIEGRRHPILRFADQHFSHHNSVEVWLFSFERDHVLLFKLRLRLSTYSMPYPINSIPILLHGHTIAVFLHSVAGSSWHALERRDGSKMMCTTQSILFLLYLELVAARLNMWFYCCFRFFFSFLFFLALIAECLSKFRLNCSHHCVITDKGTAACRCPQHQALRSDNLTCYPLGKSPPMILYISMSSF